MFEIKDELWNRYNKLTFLKGANWNGIRNQKLYQMGLLLKKKKLEYNHIISHTPTEKKTEAVIWRISLRRRKP